MTKNVFSLQVGSFILNLDLTSFNIWAYRSQLAHSGGQNAAAMQPALGRPVAFLRNNTLKETARSTILPVEQKLTSGI